MSAEEPEVNDVWLSPQGIKCRVDFLISNSRGTAVFLNHCINEYCIEYFTTTARAMLKSWKYLGKSKASIKDLFEVE